MRERLLHIGSTVSTIAFVACVLGFILSEAHMVWIWGGFAAVMIGGAIARAQGYRAEDGGPIGPWCCGVIIASASAVMLISPSAFALNWTPSEAREGSILQPTDLGAMLGAFLWIGLLVVLVVTVRYAFDHMGSGTVAHDSDDRIRDDHPRVPPGAYVLALAVAGALTVAARPAMGHPHPTADDAAPAAPIPHRHWCCTDPQCEDEVCGDCTTWSRELFLTPCADAIALEAIACSGLHAGIVVRTDDWCDFAYRHLQDECG